MSLHMNDNFYVPLIIATIEHCANRSNYAYVCKRQRELLIEVMTRVKYVILMPTKSVQ